MAKPRRTGERDKADAIQDFEKLAKEATAKKPDKERLGRFYDRVCQVVANVKDVVKIAVLVKTVFGA